MLDFTGDLYRKSLRIDIIERLRGEQKFDSAEALKTQMEKDVVTIRERLSSVQK